ncbi:MAG: hypothetical protein IPQ07_28235 [Myxococcales bacterium]|nr:hypothetical protein [Myxococcales bacterium]
MRGSTCPLDPTHERARVELSRLAQLLSRWPEATAALEAGGCGGAWLVMLPRVARCSASSRRITIALLGDAPRAIAALPAAARGRPHQSDRDQEGDVRLARLYEEGKA